jgi:hypothetical protein
VPAFTVTVPSPPATGTAFPAGSVPHTFERASAYVPPGAVGLMLTTRLINVPSGIKLWLSPTIRNRFLFGDKSTAYRLFPEVLAEGTNVAARLSEELSYSTSNWTPLTELPCDANVTWSRMGVAD